MKGRDPLLSEAGYSYGSYIYQLYLLSNFYLLPSIFQHLTSTLQSPKITWPFGRLDVCFKQASLGLSKQAA